MEQTADGDTKLDDDQLMGCAPYLQIFKGGKLLHTSAASLHVQQSDEELPFVQVLDGTIPFNINQIIQGDILIRCRHLTFGKKRVSMFRAAFHTGYAPPNVLRLTKTQLDGACNDERYSDDFFLDLIFEKVDADDIAKMEKEKESESKATSKADGEKGEKGQGAIVKASDNDSMLQGDSRFWDVIASKKQEHMKQTNSDPFWGPTVGRRRGDTKTSVKLDDDKSDKGAQVKERTQLETFSIGNEFDFLPVAETVEKDAKIDEPPKRDTLMDALNALDEEEVPGPAQVEEIVFDTSSGTSATKEPPKPIFNEETDAEIANSSEEEKVTKATDPTTTTAATTTTPPPEETTLSEDLFDDDEGFDALLASAEDDFGDLDLDDFDDDGDLEDLENLLKM